MNKLIILLLCFLYVPSILAINTVSIVYRTDDRDLAAIRDAEGMWPNWTEGVPDDDLAHHFEGESIEGGSTNFVSTTASLRTAVMHAASLARPNSEEPFDQEFVTYIYQIRPATNFYNVDASLIAARDRAPASSARRERLSHLINDYTGMAEYAAQEGFLQNRIISYARLDGPMLSQYYNDTNSVLFNPAFWHNRWIVNPHYNTAFDNDTTSPDIYPVVENPRGIMGLVTNGTQPVVPLSFTCMGTSSQRHPEKKHLLGAEPICSPNQYMNLKRNIYDKNIYALFIQ